MDPVTATPADAATTGLGAALAAVAAAAPLCTLDSVLEVAQPGDAAVELPHRAAALSIIPGLLAANALGRPLVCGWVRTRPRGSVAVLTTGFDAAAAEETSGLRRLAVPGGAVARIADGPAWARLLAGSADSDDAAGGNQADRGNGADDPTSVGSAGWRWFRYAPVFNPVAAELAGDSAVPGLRGALRGSVEDCFDIFAGHALAWLIHARPVPDADVTRELNQLAHLMPALRNKAGSAESHKLALEHAEAWFRELSVWRPHGWWDIDAYVGAHDEAVAHQAGAALTGAPELRQSTYTPDPGEAARRTG